MLAVTTVVVVVVIAVMILMVAFAATIYVAVILSTADFMGSICGSAVHVNGNKAVEGNGQRGEKAES
jgi:energy-coupling factor transporter transmembrane protein EcfT